ncbi:hypothetical protein AVEN_130926-2 [Araneus ventricosus]|uniref:A-kinase anchor protein 7-like phosphoesterase domain-containing protein n=1 Tax=Araneus ventricosus TaxID=182803 RepID=A0A4Y2FLW4_ARAVE|nr:hypothetical protein AVEN_130926-2 [Araneus ventricosus]
MKTKATSTNDKCEVQRGNERTSKIQTPKKNYLHRLKGNYTLQLSSLFSGLSDRKEGHPPSYAQGHIERETVRRNRCPLMEKNSAVHEHVKKVQTRIVQKEETLRRYLKRISTLHITLFYVNIRDKNTHERALKALKDAFDEFHKKKSLILLTFKGLGNFNDRVLYVKLERDDECENFYKLRKCVIKHFAAARIFPTDSMPYVPHITIAKINFAMGEQNGLKTIERKLYRSIEDDYMGLQTIYSLDLITGSKNDAEYYTRDSLNFDRFDDEEICSPLNIVLEFQKVALC